MGRVVYIVLDGVGIGALPDAAEYGDEGSDTLGNTSRAVSLQTPFLQSLGLGSIAPLRGVAPTERPAGFVGRLAPLSVGKDSTVGHWEQMGLVTSRPFPTYPDGFPREVMDEFSRRVGRPALGNRTASGTEIIATLGDQHVATGYPIVYTSADSVFQVAAHTDVVPLATLYSWCEAAREILTGRHGVARVIARPFVGVSGAYFRTADRRDFSLPPPGPTYLDRLQVHGVPVAALGKISELFGGRGVDRSIKVSCNDENLALLEDLMEEGRGAPDDSAQLIISNLVDFDTSWGHRNDVEAFAKGLSSADSAMARIADRLGPGDRLVLTADHGVDPTTRGTDHTREYVPLLVYPGIAGSPAAVYEGSFADAGAFAFEYLTGRTADLEGTSVAALQPIRGWRPYVHKMGSGAGAVAHVSGRVGPTDAGKAAAWLENNLGSAPDVAIVLGSGLSVNLADGAQAEVGYVDVPGWREGDVVGHASRLTMVHIEGARCALLSGRIHEYEGFDLSEVQLPLRSLRAWGVTKVILTSAAGGIGDVVEPGTLVVADRVADLQYRERNGWYESLRGTEASVLSLLAEERVAKHTLTVGGHASLPGPQYETPAEVQHLARLGMSSVSMGPAAEVRAAIDEGVELVVLSVVTNVGETSHDEVLRAAERSREILTAAVELVCSHWL